MTEKLRRCVAAPEFNVKLKLVVSLNLDGALEVFSWKVETSLMIVFEGVKRLSWANINNDYFELEKTNDDFEYYLSKDW